MKPEQSVEWLSKPRFQNFLKAVEGNHDSAVALYVWNAEISAAFLGVLHHLEVLLRNAIDRQFPPSEPDTRIAICAPSVWLTDPNVLEDQGREKVNDAIRRLVEEGRSPTRPRLVASLTFGFWVALFAGRYEALWRSTLASAFPNGNGRRTQVRKALARTLQLRNQVAHHEAIFGRNLSKDFEVMLEAAALVDEEAAGWIRALSQVEALIQQRPSARSMTKEELDELTPAMEKYGWLGWEKRAR